MPRHFKRKNFHISTVLNDEDSFTFANPNHQPTMPQPTPSPTVALPFPLIINDSSQSILVSSNPPNDFFITAHHINTMTSPHSSSSSHTSSSSTSHDYSSSLTVGPSSPSPTTTSNTSINQLSIELAVATAPQILHSHQMTRQS